MHGEQGLRRRGRSGFLHSYWDGPLLARRHEVWAPVWGRCNGLQGKPANVGILFETPHAVKRLVASAPELSPSPRSASAGNKLVPLPIGDWSNWPRFWAQLAPAPADGSCTL